MVSRAASNFAGAALLGSKQSDAAYGSPSYSTAQGIQDFKAMAGASWDAGANQRAYADSLRGQQFNRDMKSQTSAQRSSESVASTQAGAQMAAAASAADASKFGARQSADAAKHSDSMAYKGTLAQTEASKFGATAAADASKFGATAAADASRFGAKESARASMYGADKQLSGIQDTNRSQITMTGMQEAGQNYRTGITTRADLIKAAGSEATTRRGQTFGLAGQLAGSNRQPQQARYW